ncbi:sulfurtransferase [Mesorhizobium sp. SB112]|uniref:sulfurtransferase n=1 Tax=Mesorhizobium sp. SB112 TaxID=3151853 RepID=UPI003263F6CF
MPHKRSELLVSPEELAVQLSDPSLVILDCTSAVVPSSNKPGFAVASGRQAFLDGHIPGAQFIDLQEDISVPTEALLFTLPPVEFFAAAMKRFRIGHGSRVVLYSTGQPGWAARVWLMLRGFGFDNAAILDGGFSGWKQAGLPVEQGEASPCPVPAQEFDWRLREGIFVSTSDVEATKSASLVNALDQSAFRGEAAISYGRPGRIPGSINIPTSTLVDKATGRYLKQNELERLFDEAGLQEDSEIIAYCGAGVAASNVVFARILAGSDAPASVYDGSLLEWASNPDRPLVTG